MRHCEGRIAPKQSLTKRIKTFKGLHLCSPFLYIIYPNLPLISFIYILCGLTIGILYFYSMSLIVRTFILLVFLAAFAGAVEV